MAEKPAEKYDLLKYWTKGLPIVPNAEFNNCPIETSLGVLGKKWSMLILRDISMRKFERFSELLKSIPGITPRVLSMRLRKLENDELIEKSRNGESTRFVRWLLTEKGWDALPILMSYVAFGSKWYAARVFEDGKPRDMNEIYPQRNLKRLYVNIEVEKKKSKRAPVEEPSRERDSWKY